jgi:hypothetical protein
MYSRRIAPKGTAGEVFRSIYRLEGDTLTLASRSGGEEEEGLPTSFHDGSEGTWLEVYERPRR